MVYYCLVVKTCLRILLTQNTTHFGSNPLCLPYVYGNSKRVGRNSTQYIYPQRVGRNPSKYIYSQRVGRNSSQYIYPQRVGRNSTQYIYLQHVGRNPSQYIYPQLVFSKNRLIDSLKFSGVLRLLSPTTGSFCSLNNLL